MRYLVIALLLVTCLTSASQQRVVEMPELHAKVFLPSAKKSTGRSVVILPGGGYSHTAMNHEGYDWAPFFNNLGMACAVVDYRMPHGDRTVPINDALGVMKLMKDSASVWSLDPAQVGVMGSSAGGHLASIVATQSPDSLRPAFQILFYPVISMDKAYTHKGSHDNLLGPDASEELERAYTGELNVTRQTPRAILLLSADDKTVVPHNSLAYSQALIENGVPCSIHVWPTGGHGWGGRMSFKYHAEMLAELAEWLRSF